MDDSIFSVLPNETKYLIASFLNDRSRRMMRATSTFWFEIIKYDDFTIYFARSSMLPDLIQTFHRYSNLIGLHFEKTISLDNSFTILGTMTNLTRLDIEPTRTYPGSIGTDFLSHEDQDHFTALTALQRISFNYVNISPHIWKHLPNLTQITIKHTHDLRKEAKSSKKKKIHIISKLRTRNLTKIRALDFYDTLGILTFDTELISKMSNLSKVSIHCRDALFPFSKLPNLEYLNIVSDQFDDFSVNTKLTWLSIHAREKMEIAKVTVPHDYQQLTALTNLKYLQLIIIIEEHEYSFLSKLTNLESLSVSEQTFNPLSGQYLQFINSTKLTSLQVLEPTKVEYISHLTNLRHLEYPIKAPDPTDLPFKLTNVTSLITRHISMAKYCPNLKSLGVWNRAKLIDCQILRSLTQLESVWLETPDNQMFQLLFDVEYTNLSQLQATCDFYREQYNFEGLRKLTALKELEIQAIGDLRRSNCIGFLESLPFLTNLEKLHLDQIDDETVQVLECLPKLTHLRIIALNARSYDEAKFSNLTNLQRLERISMDMKKRSTSHDCKLSNLPYLYDCVT